MTIGILYDGTRKRLAGKGPNTFTSAMDTKFHFKSMLYDTKNNVVNRSDLRSDDRLWVLPTSFDLTQTGMSNLLVDLANIIKAGNRVGLASSNKYVLESAKDALIHTLQNFTGSA